MSRVGHLSNLGMAEFLLRDLSAATAQLVLGHISAQNNHPEIVRLMANEALGKRGLDTQLTLASQRAPTEVFRF
jgi:phosphoribosyl 1,2-cyclic phosphodiesterase